jgi:hypothetical protein
MKNATPESILVVVGDQIVDRHDLVPRAAHADVVNSLQLAALSASKETTHDAWLAALVEALEKLGWVMQSSSAGMSPPAAQLAVCRAHSSGGAPMLTIESGEQSNVLVLDETLFRKVREVIIRKLGSRAVPS